MQDRPIEITLYAPPNSQSSPPVRHQTTIEGLLASLCTPPERVAKKGNASAWSPIVYRGERRLNTHAEKICALVYDLDDPEYDYSALGVRLQELDWVYVIHETFTDGCARLVLPLAEDLSPMHYRLARENVAQMLQLQHDPACSDLSRLFYSPSCLPEAKREPAERGGSKLLVPPKLDRVISLAGLKDEVKGLRDKEKREKLLSLIDGTLVLPPGTRNATVHQMMAQLAQLRNAPSEEDLKALLVRVFSRREFADRHMDTWLAEALHSYQRGQDYRSNKDEAKAHIESLFRPEVQTAEGKGWKTTLIYNKDRSGNPLPSVRSDFTNLTTVLAHDAAFAGNLRWNNMSMEVEVTGGPFLGTTPVSLIGEVTRSLQLNPEYQFAPALTTSLVGEAVHAVARQNEYNPVRAYLDALPAWDGTPRLANLLLRYANARGNEEWIKKLTTKFFVSAVARVMEPGCQVDTALILQGGQGGGKTSFVRTMGGEFAVELHLDVHDRDTLMVVHGAWLVELSELASLQKANDESGRSFISRTEDRLRLPYARAAERLKRKCVFIGTTNSDEPLKDPAGHRRFWPVTVGMIDVAGLKLVRDQLWAEALHLYNAKEQWWLTQEETYVAAEEAALYEASDDPIAEEMIFRLNEMSPDRRPTEVTLRYIVSEIFMKMPGDSVAELERKILRSLRKLKWKKTRRQSGGFRNTFYTVPAKHQLATMPEGPASQKKEQKQ